MYGIAGIKALLKNKAQPHIRTYCKDLLLKKLWYWPKHRHLDQWKTKKSSESDLFIYEHLINEIFSTFEHWGKAGVTENGLESNEIH